MPISKREIDWKDYDHKEMLYRGMVLELLMGDKENAYTFLEICSHIYGKLGQNNVKMDKAFEGNVRAALLDPRIALQFYEGETYYSIKENPPTR